MKNRKINYTLNVCALLHFHTKHIFKLYFFISLFAIAWIPETYFPIGWLSQSYLFFKNYFHSFFSKQIFTNKQTTFSIILCKKVWGRPCCIFISKPEFIAPVFATAKHISKQHYSFPCINFAKIKKWVSDSLYQWWYIVWTQLMKLKYWTMYVHILWNP